MKEKAARVVNGGRVTIPAEHRRALGIGEGDEVLIGLFGNSIRIQTRRDALARARGVVERAAEANAEAKGAEVDGVKDEAVKDEAGEPGDEA